MEKSKYEKESQYLDQLLDGWEVVSLTLAPVKAVESIKTSLFSYTGSASKTIRKIGSSDFIVVADDEFPEVEKVVSTLGASKKESEFFVVRKTSSEIHEDEFRVPDYLEILKMEPKLKKLIRPIEYNEFIAIIKENLQSCTNGIFRKHGKYGFIETVLRDGFDSKL